jgi:tetratricopeptide (TPR) repeat protein
MDVLRKVFLIMVSLVLLFQARAQSEMLMEAFSDSYNYEQDAEYNKAIEVLKKVYREDSYEINLRLGWLHYYAGLFSESASYYRKAVALKSFSIEAKFGLIMPLAASGNWEEVIVHYKKILELDPKNSYANYKLGSIYYGREEYATAYKYFEIGLNMYPFDYDFNHMAAWTNLNLAKSREAKVLFQKTLMIKPDDKSAKEGLDLLK